MTTFFEKNYDLLEEKAEMLRSMGHPLRLAIIHLLIESDELMVTDIYTKLDIEQAVASHHLRILKKNKVLASQKKGKFIYYFVKSPSVQIIIAEILDKTE